MIVRARRAAVLATVIAVTAPLAACADNTPAGSDDTNGGDDYPPGSIELIAAGDAGGGLDLLSREVQEALGQADLADTTINIQNMGGGSGNPAMARAQQDRGGDGTLVVNSNRVYLNPITGNSELELDDDFIAIAQLMTEYVVLAVRDDSPYQEATDVLDALEEDPKALSLGVGTVPSDDQLHLLRAANESGIDPSELNIVAFSAGGDLMTQLLGGHVDAISTGLSEALPQYESGEIRILAISAPERVDGPGSDIPTWDEQGLDLVVEHWRGIFGPPEMPDYARDYWVDTFEQMTESGAWEEVLERNGWSPVFRGSEDFAATLEEEAETAEDLLADVGLTE